MIVRKLIKEKLGLCNDLDNWGKPNTAPTLQRKSLKIPYHTYKKKRENRNMGRPLNHEYQSALSCPPTGFSYKRELVSGSDRCRVNTSDTNTFVYQWKG